MIVETVFWPISFYFNQFLYSSRRWLIAMGIKIESSVFQYTSTDRRMCLFVMKIAVAET